MCGMFLSLRLVSHGPVKLVASHCEATVARPSKASYHDGRTPHVSSGNFGSPSHTIYLWEFSQPYLGCCSVRYPVCLPCLTDVSSSSPLRFKYWRSGSCSLKSPWRVQIKSRWFMFRTRVCGSATFLHRT